MVAKFLDLDRDGHLHFQTMEKSMGYRFAPKYNHAPRKDCICHFYAIFAGPQFVETQKFCYHGNET